MRTARLSFMVAALVVACFTAAASMAQNTIVRDSLFKETDAAFAEALKAHANWLAPMNYTEAADYYRRADSSFNRGRSTESVRRTLVQANEALRKAMESTRIAEVTLATVIKARTDAESADAENFASKFWQEGTRRFSVAAKRLEQGNVKRAQVTGAEAEKILREAELEAIKANYLNGARTLLTQAEQSGVERYAPKTLTKARQLLEQASTELTQSRYDPDLPRRMAREAQYEASHAIYLADLIRKTRNRQLDIEDVLLELETPVIEIGSALDMAVRMDKGYQAPTAEIIKQVTELRVSSENMTQDLGQLNMELAELQEELGGTSERMQAHERVRQQMSQLESLFQPGEARILREQNDVVVRLTGLSFRSGQWVIDSEYFDLLRQVQDAIDTFPNSTVVVQGHTDSNGADDANRGLSQRRADAVRQYLQANMGLPAWRLDAVGYGETKPVANNETSEGRAYNRRIDILIQPQNEGRASAN
jgi:OOP family OmpA-OmpF porin